MEKTSRVRSLPFESFYHSSDNVPKCKICLSKRSRDLIYPQGVFRCDNCGCIFRPKDVDINLYYDLDYWYKGDEELKLHQKARFAWFEDYIWNGNSIEFGAADGDFTHLVREFIEDHHEVHYSEIKDLLRPEYLDHKIEKYIGRIEDYKKDNFYHNVFLIDVIEHLNDIRNVFRSVRKMLVLDGRFFISTNDGDSFDAHLPMFYHLEHTCMLTRYAFEVLAHEYSFKIVKYFKAPQNWLYVILEKKIGHEIYRENK